MPSTVISYPAPPYSNLPIRADYYQPHKFEITGVTLGQTTIVTTSIAHDYVVGNLCRLLIPNGYGCLQLSGKTGYVISIPSSTQVELSIKSINANAFVAASLPQKPQIIPVGDINNGSINGSGRINQITYIPGSFINVSPG